MPSREAWARLRLEVCVTCRCGIAYPRPSCNRANFPLFDGNGTLDLFPFGVIKDADGHMKGFDPNCLSGIRVTGPWEAVRSARKASR